MFVQVKRVVYEDSDGTAVLHRGDPVPSSMPDDVLDAYLAVDAVGESDPTVVEVEDESEPVEDAFVPVDRAGRPFDFDEADDPNPHPHHEE